MKLLNKSIPSIKKLLTSKDWEDVSEVVLLGKQGQWSQAFSFKSKKKEYVIKFSNQIENFLNDKFAYQFSTDFIPIPKVVDIGEYDNGYYAILEKAEGVHIDTLEKNEMQRVVPSILELFGALKKANVSKSIGFGGWDKNGNGVEKSWKEYLLKINNDDKSRFNYGWYKKLKESKFGDGSFKKIFKELVSLIDYCPEERYLIHGDLLYFNVLVEKEKINAVLDWGCAKYGDFLYDVAWFVFWSHWYPAMENIDFYKEAYNYFKSRRVDLKNYKERILCYSYHIALDSIIYSVYKDNWKFVKDVSEYTMKLISNNK